MSNVFYNKNRADRSRGFTLLELLLVVGIAAVLIIAGIVTYNAVSNRMAINEVVKITNLILSQTRRHHPTGQYGAPGTSLEALLVNSGSIPAKYISGDQLITKFENSAASILLTTFSPETFELQMRVPSRDIVNIAPLFIPSESQEITYLGGCAHFVTDDMPMYDIPAIAAQCGASTDLTYLVIRSR